MAFTDAVLRFAPWSFSKHGKLELCPLQFHKSYVVREPETSSRSESRVGVVVHKVLETVEHEPDLDPDSLLEAEVAATGMTTDEHRDAQAFMPMVHRFVGFLNHFCIKHHVSKRLVEYDAAIYPDFTAAPYGDRSALIRGKVDLALPTGNNDLIIIDHKSGKKKPIDEHAVQLNVYRLFAVAQYPQIRSVQCAIHYVADGSLLWDRPMTRDHIVAQLRPWLETYLNKHDAVLRRMDPATPPAAKTSWACEWCGFVNNCPAGLDYATQRRTEREAKKSLRVVNV